MAEDMTKHLPSHPLRFSAKRYIPGPKDATMGGMATPVTAAAPPVRLDDFEPAARELLPRAIYDYFAGAAEDEAALAGNREAFRRYRFRFKVLASTLEPDLRCEILGDQLSMPVQLAPTATQRMAHPEGELAAARAAADAKVIYALS